MKKQSVISLAAMLGIAVGLLAAPAHAATTYKITPEKSKVTFTIKNKPPGASDFQIVPGSFKDFSGSMTLGSDQAQENSVTMEVKTASVDTANERRDDHLRNPDFFKVKEFPTMTFKSKQVRKVSATRYEVKGDFTLLGKTKPIEVVYEESAPGRGTAKFELKRSEFGMDYRVPDTADEVHVTLEIVGEK